jgi:hypothetical protein
LGGGVGQFVLAGVIAVAVTALELITTKFPRTPAFVVRSVWFYVYIFAYGVIAAGAYALLPLIGTRVDPATIGLSNPWIQAGVVGLSVKALLHIRVFNVSTGPGRDFPVGLETIVLLFEPWLIRSIELDVFSQLMGFVGPRASQCPTLSDAQSRAINNIPNTFSPAEKAALIADIMRATVVTDVIVAYISYAGLNVTRKVFP